MVIPLALEDGEPHTLHEDAIEKQLGHRGGPNAEIVPGFIF